MPSLAERVRSGAAFGLVILAATAAFIHGTHAGVAGSVIAVGLLGLRVSLSTGVGIVASALRRPPSRRRPGTGARRGSGG